PGANRHLCRPDCSRAGCESRRLASARSAFPASYVTLSADTHRPGACPLLGAFAAAGPQQPHTRLSASAIAYCAARPCPYGTEVRMTDPIQTFEGLKQAYLRYFDSPYD